MFIRAGIRPGVRNARIPGLMATVGYYLRGCDTWARIRIDETYIKESVVAGLSHEDAVAQYWRKLEELVMPASAAGDAAPVEREPRRRTATARTQVLTSLPRQWLMHADLA
jgi:hypothetical protein